MKVIFLFIFLFLLSCKTTTEVTDNQIDKFPLGNYVINHGGCCGSDSVEFTRVGNNLYQDNKNKLYFLCYDRSDETGKKIKPVFILRFPTYCEGDAGDTLFDLSETIDVPSFKKSEDGFYRDKYHKYEFVSSADGGQLHIVQNDRWTYKELGKGFYLGADNKMYIETAPVLDGGKGDGSGPPFFREVPLVDVRTFENLGPEGWYAKDSTKVYMDHFMTDGRHLWLLEEADAATFQSIGYRWGKDKNHVFENGIMLEGLHPDSMIILCPETTEYKQVFFSMVKDNNQVFCGYTEMKDVDAPTFECIKSDSSISYRDKNWNYNEHYFPNRDEKNRFKR